jgi:hypothetical protein
MFRFVGVVRQVGVDSDVRVLAMLSIIAQWIVVRDCPARTPRHRTHMIGAHCCRQLSRAVGPYVGRRLVARTPVAWDVALTLGPVSPGSRESE